MMDGPTDCQVEVDSTQVVEKPFQWRKIILKTTWVDLCWLVKRLKTCVPAILRSIGPSRCKQTHGVASKNSRYLATLFGQGLKLILYSVVRSPQAVYALNKGDSSWVHKKSDGVMVTPRIFPSPPTPPPSMEVFSRPPRFSFRYGFLGVLVLTILSNSFVGRFRTTVTVNLV